MADFKKCSLCDGYGTVSHSNGKVYPYSIRLMPFPENVTKCPRCKGIGEEGE